MKKTVIVSVLLILAGLAWYLVSSNSTANTGAGETPETNAADNQQALTVVTPWELTSLDPSTSGFIFQRIKIIWLCLVKKFRSKFSAASFG